MWEDDRGFTCDHPTPNGSEVCPAVTNAYLRAAGNNVFGALTNTGGIRLSLQQGDLTQDDIKDLLPFEGKLLVVELSGKTIKHVLEDSIAYAINFFDGEIDPSDNERSGSGAYPCAAGLRWDVDLTKIYGDRFTNIEYNNYGTWYELTDNTVLKVVVNDFIAGGGNGYFALEDAIHFGAEVLDLNVTDQEAFLSYAASVGTIEKGHFSTKSFVGKDVCKREH